MLGISWSSFADAPLWQQIPMIIVATILLYGVWVLANRKQLNKIPVDSPRYKLLEVYYRTWEAGGISPTRVASEKICFVQWFILPIAALALVLTTLWVGLAPLCRKIRTTVIFSIMAFFGYWLKDYKIGEYYHSYGSRTLPNGKRIPLAPWQVFVVGYCILLAYAFGLTSPETVLTIGKWVAIVAIAIMALAGVILVISGKWSNPFIQRRRQVFIDWWNNQCTSPVVVDPDGQPITNT